MRRKPAIKVTTVYAGLAATWILVSSGLIPALDSVMTVGQWVELAKGLVFVLVTAVALYQALRRIARDETLRYQLLLAEHPQPMLLIDPGDGRIVDANRAAAVFYRWPLDRLRALTLFDLAVSPRELVADDLRQVCDRRRLRFETKHRLGFDEICEVEMFAGPARIADRELVYSVVVDVSERQRAVRELADRERRFHALFEHALSAVVILVPVRDAEGLLVDFTVLDCNNALREHLDIDPGRAVGRHWSEVVPEADREALFMPLADVLAGVGSSRFEAEAFGRTLAVNAYRIGLDQLVAVFADVSAGARAQQALRASEARYRDMFEHNPNPMWVFDVETLAFLDVNDAAVRKYGYSREEFLTMSIDRIRPPEDVVLLRVDVARPRVGAEAPERWRHLLKNGRLIEVEVACHDFEFDGRPARMVLIHDLSDRIRIENALRESEERLSLALLGANDGWWDWDLESDRLYYSPRWWSMLGYAHNELPADSGLWRRLAHPEDLPEAERIIRETLAEGRRRYRVECRMRHRDGHWLPIVSSGLVTYSGEKPIRISGANADLSGFHRLDEQRRMIERVFVASSQGMMIVDRDGVILDVNPAFEAITGYSRDEVIGRSPRLLQSGRHDQAFYAALWQTLTETGQWRGEVWNRRKSGEIYPEWLTISADRDEQGRVRQYIGVFSDLTQVRQANDKAEYLLRHDPLTGLINRAALIERMTHGLARARRASTGAAAVLVAVEGLTAVVDGLGHPAGDQALAGVARRLAAQVRASEVLARFGERVFAVFSEDAAVAEHLASLAGRLLSVFDPAIEIDGHRLVLTADIGIALFPDDGETVTDLLKHAESALDAARAAGPRRWRCFSEALGQQAERRLQLESGLVSAIERDELLLHVQPQVDQDTQALAGVEVLLRWRHPALGLLGPGEFIPVAERLGLMPDIGAWVIDALCTHLKEWRARGIVVPLAAVNVSVQQLDSTELPGQVAAALSRHGVDAGQIELELTESMLMRDPEQARLLLTRLRELGVGLALDDFGTGYSSLASLSRLPLTRLKIDRSFVAQIGREMRAEGIVRAVIGLGRSLGLTVVAEGIETPEQAEFLRREGCRVGQGFLYARPMPIATLPDWLGLFRQAHTEG